MPSKRLAFACACAAAAATLAIAAPAALAAVTSEPFSAAPPAPTAVFTTSMV